MTRAFAVFAAALTATLTLAAPAWAQTSPVGLWKTIDDDGKTEKSLVRITEAGGVLNGKVEKIFEVAKQNEVCEDCKDERKGQRKIGRAHV